MQARWPRGAPDDEHGKGQGGRFAEADDLAGGWAGQALSQMGFSHQRTLADQIRANPDVARRESTLAALAGNGPTANPHSLNMRGVTGPDSGEPENWGPYGYVDAAPDGRFRALTITDARRPGSTDPDRGEWFDDQGQRVD